LKPLSCEEIAANARRNASSHSLGQQHPVEMGRYMGKHNATHPRIYLPQALHLGTYLGLWGKSVVTKSSQGDGTSSISLVKVLSRGVVYQAALERQVLAGAISQI